MKNFKKIISSVTAVALAASMFAGLSISASAKTEVLSENFDDSSTIGSFWTANSGDCVLEISDGTLRAGNNANGDSRNAAINLDSTADGSFAEVDFDFSSANIDSANYTDSGFKVCDANGNAIFMLSLPNHRYSAQTATLNDTALTNVTLPTKAQSDWYTLKAILNFDSQTFDYKVYAQGGTDVLAEGNDAAMSASAAGVGRIQVYVNRAGAKNGKANAIYLDNFYLASLDGPSVTIPSETVEVDTGASAEIAQIADAEDVTVTSSDESIATAAYADGAVTVTGVSSGKADVSIAATSADGVTIRKTVQVASGGVELVNITVNYIYQDGDNTVTVADSTTLTDVAVGTKITLSDVTYDEVVEASDYRYTNPSLTEYEAVSGTDNSVNVVYANRDAAVSQISVVYKNGDTTVQTKSVDIGSGYYAGDSYTYTSTAYVVGTDDVIYAIGEDYTEDADSTDLNGTTVKVNAVLEQTLTLSESTTAEYEATVSSNAEYYAEWEDALGLTASAKTCTRFVPSGGATVALGTTGQEFYPITQTGYYQIIVVTSPKSRGTEIFATLAEAQAATEIGTGLVNVVGSNNDQYGAYAAKTVLLEEGDNLAVRGWGTSNYTDNLDYVLIRHITSSEIYGADGVSIIPGGQSSTYSFDPGVDADTVWSVSEAEGVSIDQDGVLTVADTASEGTVTITATADSVTGTKEISIAKAQVADFDFDGATSLSVGQSSQYTVSNVVDQFGADITSAAAISYSTSDDSVATIDDNGLLTVNAAGSVTVTASVDVNGASLIKDIDASSAVFFITADATGDSTSIDISDMVKNDYLSGYLVTTATADGEQVSQEIVTTDETTITVDTTGAAKAEISPIFTYSDLGNLGDNTTPLEGAFADGFYNITFTKTNFDRSDIYVNGYMVGNNVCQEGTGRSSTDESRVYTANDVNVKGGEITVSMTDCVSGHSSSAFAMSEIVVKKAPSIVTRTPKIYVIGDSLVAAYYGDVTTEVGSSRTGWGQVLENFIDDSYEVVDLANSGQYAKGLYTTAFPGVIYNAQPGDYLIIESGYNDRTYSTRDEMYEYVTKMVEESKEAGITPILVSPNASAHDFKTGVQYASTMTDVANDTGAMYVDLAAESYNFMVSTGISTKASAAGTYITADYAEDGTLTAASLLEVAADKNIAPTGDKNLLWDMATMIPVTITSYTTDVDATYNLSTAGGDTLHSSYAAAMKWAQIVAQGMKDAGLDFINTDFSYTFTDTVGNEIVVQVK